MHAVEFPTVYDLGTHMTASSALISIMFCLSIIFLSSTQVKQAEDLGAVGVILYSDPEDCAYGNYSQYPSGVMMPPSGVQLGTVNVNNGDPSTPFYPSVGKLY